MHECTDQFVHCCFIQTNHLIPRLLEPFVVHCFCKITRWHFCTFIHCHILQKSNIVVQKYIDDLAESQNNINLNNLDEKNEEVKKEVDGDIYNSFANKIEVQDDDDEKKTNTSKCMKKMKTTSRTKAKKMKSETKFIL